MDDELPMEIVYRLYDLLQHIHDLLISELYLFKDMCHICLSQLHDHVVCLLIFEGFVVVKYVNMFGLLHDPDFVANLAFFS